MRGLYQTLLEFRLDPSSHQQQRPQQYPQKKLERLMDAPRLDTHYWTPYSSTKSEGFARIMKL